MADALKLSLHDGARPAPEPVLAYKTELDDRCLLFPDGKVISHLQITREAGRTFGFDAVFPFNRTRLPSRFLKLSHDELQQLTRELIDCVYAAKSGFVLHQSLKISIMVMANGYRLEFQQADAKADLYLSTSVIWRVIRTMMMAVDEASPVVSH